MIKTALATKLDFALPANLQAILDTCKFEMQGHRKLYVWTEEQWYENCDELIQEFDEWCDIQMDSPDFQTIFVYDPHHSYKGIIHELPFITRGKFGGLSVGILL